MKNFTVKRLPHLGKESALNCFLELTCPLFCDRSRYNFCNKRTSDSRVAKFLVFSKNRWQSVAKKPKKWWGCVTKKVGLFTLPSRKSDTRIWPKWYNCYKNVPIRVTIVPFWPNWCNNCTIWLNFSGQVITEVIIFQSSILLP